MSTNNSFAHIYDSVFKTIAERMPSLLIPLINEIFDRDYDSEVVITQLDKESNSPFKKLATDALLRIEDKIYHLESQSTEDDQMPIRMLEYDLFIALHTPTRDNLGNYSVRLPNASVIYLRRAKHPKPEVHVYNPEGTHLFDYQYKTFDLKDLDAKQLIEKKLYVLFPYYVLNYEKDFDKMETDSALKQAFLDDLNNLNTDLYAAVSDKATYNRLREHAQRVIQHVLRKHDGLRREVAEIMGGEVLESVYDEIERLEQENAKKDSLLAQTQRESEQRIAQAQREAKQQTDRLIALLKADGYTDEQIQNALAGTA